MRPTFTRGRRLLAALLPLVCAFSFAAPAHAAFSNVFVTDGDPNIGGSGVPVDSVSANQNLWIYVQGDLIGGKVCIVPATRIDNGSGGLSCNDPAWGSQTNPSDGGVAGVTHIGDAVNGMYVLIQSAPLKAGTWRIAADGGTAPGDDVLSDTFTVTPCPPGQCDYSAALAESGPIKAKAKQMRDSLIAMKYALEGASFAKEKVAELLKSESDDKEANIAQNVLKGDWAAAGKQMKSYIDTTKQVSVLAGGGVDGMTFSEPEPNEVDNPFNTEELAMAMAKTVTDRGILMYNDIWADPPLTDYQNVEAPAFQPPGVSSGDPGIDAGIANLDGVAAYGEAGLHAYERYQGALAAADVPGQHRQTEAMASNFSSMEDAMRSGAATLHAIAAQVTADPIASQAVIDQQEFAQVKPYLDAIAAHGFTSAEKDVLYNDELDDAQIADLQSQLTQLDQDIPQFPTTPVKLSDAINQGADALDFGTGEFDDFARVSLAQAENTNTPPTASWTAPSNAFNIGEPITFDGSASTDDSKIVDYAWTFDDGTTLDGPVVTHAFATGGAHSVTLTVTDDDGATGQSAQLVTVNTPAPRNTALPVISGTTTDGQALTTTDGTWDSGSLASYDWQRCDANGANCVDTGAPSVSGYTLTPDDVGHSMVVIVTYSGSGGSTPATSAPSAVIAAVPVNAASLPTDAEVDGGTVSGMVLAGSDGSYTGTTPVTVARRWLRCASDGSNCQPISGATDLTYELTDQDIGSTIAYENVVTNPAGPVNFDTSPSPVVVASVPPTVVTAPSISGDAIDGSNLTVDPGTWSRSVNFGYQWRRCASDGTTCVDIPGAVSTSYQATPDDVGHTLVVHVHAYDAQGAAGTDTAASPVVAPQPPQQSSDGIGPSIGPTTTDATGMPYDGALMSSANGDWVGTPTIAFTYQWQRCDADGTNCADIPGATDSGYALGVSDVAHQVRLEVTATNAGGHLTVASPESGVVDAFPNTYVVAPGYKATDIVKGFGPPQTPGSGGIGPIGLAIGPDGSIYVAQWGGDIYKLPPSGGTASPYNQITHGLQVQDLAFDREGNLFATDHSAGVIQVNLADPANPVQRVITTVSGLGLAVDPLSDDVFFNDGNSYRILGTHTDHPELLAYGSGGDGMVFGPDGTLYTGNLVSESSTASAPVVQTPLGSVPSSDGLAVAASSDPSTPPYILANRNDGIITKVDLTQIDPATNAPLQTEILSNGTRGDFAAVGPDGCLYATQSVSIVKVTNADGTCSLAPSSPDRTPPATTPTRSIAPNVAGWNRHAVGVQLAATDNFGGSGVKSITWSLTGAQTGASTDPGALTHTALITTPGVTTVHFHATDRAGNQEPEKTLVLQLDRSAPTVTVDAPADAANIDQGAAVNSSYQCADETGGSGLATCSGDLPSGAPLDTTVLGTHSFGVIGTDLAGNTTTVTHAYTVVDQQAPTSAATASPAANAAGWNLAGPVTVHISAADPAGPGSALAGSGVANIIYSLTGAQTLAAHRLDAASKAGEDVDVPVTASGVTTVHYHAVDVAGNAEPEHTFTVKIDPTAPTEEISTPSEGQHLTQGSAVTVASSCADEAGGSGLASCTGSAANGQPVDTSTLGAHTLTLTGTDGAGNSSTLTRTYYVDAAPAPQPSPPRDTRAPSITIASPDDGQTVSVGDPLGAQYACADEAGGSGLASCQGSVAGHAVPSGARLDTSVPGTYTLTVTAVDRAGNRASASRSWTVSPRPPVQQQASQSLADQVTALPSPAICVSKRRFAIHLHQRRGVTLVSAKVFVNGKAVKVITGAGLKATVNLKGLPKGRFTVRIVARTGTGQTLASSRHYHTCIAGHHAKKKGKH